MAHVDVINVDNDSMIPLSSWFSDGKTPVDRNITPSTITPSTFSPLQELQKLVTLFQSPFGEVHNSAAVDLNSLNHHKIQSLVDRFDFFKFQQETKSLRNQYKNLCENILDRALLFMQITRSLANGDGKDLFETIDLSSFCQASKSCMNTIFNEWRRTSSENIGYLKECLKSLESQLKQFLPSKPTKRSNTKSTSTCGRKRKQSHATSNHTRLANKKSKIEHVNSNNSTLDDDDLLPKTRKIRSNTSHSKTSGHVVNVVNVVNVANDHELDNEDTALSLYSKIRSIKACVKDHHLLEELVLSAFKHVLDYVTRMCQLQNYAMLANLSKDVLKFCTLVDKLRRHHFDIQHDLAIEQDEFHDVYQEWKTAYMHSVATSLGYNDNEDMNVSESSSQMRKTKRVITNRNTFDINESNDVFVIVATIIRNYAVDATTPVPDYLEKRATEIISKLEPGIVHMLTNIYISPYYEMMEILLRINRLILYYKSNFSKKATDEFTKAYVKPVKSWSLMRFRTRPLPIVDQLQPNVRWNRNVLKTVYKMELENNDLWDIFYAHSIISKLDFYGFTLLLGMYSSHLIFPAMHLRWTASAKTKTLSWNDTSARVSRRRPTVEQFRNEMIHQSKLNRCPFPVDNVSLINDDVMTSLQVQIKQATGKLDSVKTECRSEESFSKKINAILTKLVQSNKS